ncbi:MAG: hypothetical protein MI700_02055, partial [Balneolales bacterium]|nr:hypothetical protein [Balneolales bacterium]
KDEMLDVATGQFGGTIAFFGSGLIMDKLLDRFYNRVKKGTITVKKTATLASTIKVVVPNTISNSA